MFLDEIGELHADLQPKLLRVLEKREVRRSGRRADPASTCASSPRPTATSRTEVNAGRFRADLFYRLERAARSLAPLRERARTSRCSPPTSTASCRATATRRRRRELLARWSVQRWAGNVRELRSAVERAVLMGEGPVPELAEGSLTGAEGSYRREKSLALAAWESRFVADLIQQHDGNISRAARAVKMDRNHLRALLQRYRTAYRSSVSSRPGRPGSPSCGWRTGPRAGWPRTGRRSRAGSMIGSSWSRGTSQSSVRRHSTQPIASTGPTPSSGKLHRHARQQRQRLAVDERAVGRQVAQRAGELLADGARSRR